MSEKVFLFCLNVENVFKCIYFIVYFFWSVYLHAVFLLYFEKSNFRQKISIRVNQRKIENS